MRNVRQYILILFPLIYITACKKYPENTLWFKNPKNITPFVGNLTKYTVNGIDSLDALSYYIAEKTGYGKDIRACSFTTSGDNYEKRYSAFIIPQRGSVPLKYTFSKDKKEMFISNRVDSNIFNKNLFIGDNVPWKIIRLAKTGPFKIEANINGNKYEIELKKQ